MKKKIYILVIIVFMAAVAAGCRKEIPQLNRPEDYFIGGSFTATFEMFWSGMNHNYVFWEIDTTDWDRVYNEYYPKFKALDTVETDIADKRDTARRYYCEMTKGLIDGHYTVVFDDNTGFVPSYARLDSNYTPELWREYHSYFLNICNNNLINRRNYIRGNFIVITGYIAVEGGIVPYFFWNNFYILKNIKEDRTEQLSDAIESFYDMVKRSDVKGVILDVRGNGGGNAVEPGWILGGLIDRETVMAYTKRKNGEGRLDYTPWIPFRILPLSGAPNITAPIVILTDIHSVSCSELVTMGVRNLPNGNGVQIGKTTYGGNGKLTYNAIENGGQFSTVILFNGIEPQYQQIKLVYTSSEMTKAAFDGKCYEGKGIPPNIDIALDITKYQNGIDTQLERALQYIATGN